MPDTKISAATNTTPPLSTDMLPLARAGDTTARKITVGEFLANALTSLNQLVLGNTGITSTLLRGLVTISPGGSIVIPGGPNIAYISFGNTPAYAGTIRSMNPFYVACRNLEDTADIAVIEVDQSGTVFIGSHLYDDRLVLCSKVAIDVNVDSIRRAFIDTNGQTTFYGGTGADPLVHLKKSGNPQLRIEDTIGSGVGKPNLMFVNDNDANGVGLWGDRQNISKIFFGTSAFSPTMTIFASLGFVGIGTVTPTSPLQVAGLPTYANNAAALAASLTAGAFYRSNSDPDVVCVVH